MPAKAKKAKRPSGRPRRGRSDPGPGPRSGSRAGGHPRRRAGALHRRLLPGRHCGCPRQPGRRSPWQTCRTRTWPASGSWTRRRRDGRRRPRRATRRRLDRRGRVGRRAALYVSLAYSALGQADGGDRRSGHFVVDVTTGEGAPRWRSIPCRRAWDCWIRSPSTRSRSSAGAIGPLLGPSAPGAIAAGLPAALGERLRARSAASRRSRIPCTGSSTGRAPRAVATVDADGAYRVRVRAADSKRWRKVYQTSVLDDRFAVPVAFADDDRGLLMMSDEGGSARWSSTGPTSAASAA